MHNIAMKILYIPVAIIALASCTAEQNSDTNAVSAEQEKGPAFVDLRVTPISEAEKSDKIFEQTAAFTVPNTHKIGDKIFPYEGIGWENEGIGYRLYLDERSVSDVFGKKTDKVILDIVDYRNDYHSIADWGMDVMKVGDSLGIGGIGIYRADKLERIGQSTITANVTKASGKEAAFEVKYENVLDVNNKSGEIISRYSISTGSPITWVNVQSTLPRGIFASGLSFTDGAKYIDDSNSEKNGDWRYIAAWGDKRSEAKDALGTVLFFKNNDAKIMPQAIDTYPIQFYQNKFSYGFAAVWQQGAEQIDSEEKFMDWIEKQYQSLPQ